MRGTILNVTTPVDMFSNQPSQLLMFYYCTDDCSEAGGVAQRKSFAYAIQQIQRLHQDTHEWDKFKKNWQYAGVESVVPTSGGVEIDEEGDSNRSLETSHVHLVDSDHGDLEEEKKDTKSMQREMIASSLAEGVRLALLRGSQVQEWILVEKGKEIESLKKQLEESTRENDMLRSQFEERNTVLQQTVVELLAKIKKQEKTINHELKTIRSIATKRAGTRTTSKGAQLQQHPETSDQRTSANELSSSSLTVSSQAAPPRLPARKASEKVGRSENGIVLDVASSDIAIVASVASPVAKEEPPKLPIRQSSEQQPVAKAVAASVADRSHGETRHDVRTRVSLNNQQNNDPPSLPQRQASQETELVKKIPDITMFRKPEKTSTGIATAHVARLELTTDPHTDESIFTPLASIRQSSGEEPEQQPSSRAAQESRSFDVEGVNEEEADALTKIEAGNFSSQEISFVPTDFELLGTGQPPPPPSYSPQSRNGYIEASMKMTDNKMSSQEIQFDASSAFLESKDLVRESSVTEMHFDASQQLLLEASQALSLSVIRTPYTQIHRKTAETSPSGGEAKKEIEFGGTSQQEFEFDVPQVDGDDGKPLAKPLYQSTKNKTGEDPLQAKVFGKSAIASDEDEQDDDYDFLGSLPSEIPVGSDRFLECNRSTNLSPVSALTTTSYLFDSGGAGGVGDDEDCDNGPRKALHQSGFSKRLPLEENFESDDDADGNEAKYSESLGFGSPKFVQIIHGDGKRSSSAPSKQGFSKKMVSGANYKSSSKANRKGIKVENQIVHDKYGDSGMYSGNISMDARLPHGFGKMKYDNGRGYEGNWKGGRWHGFGRWVNPNEDTYEGSFVYDARHGSGTYTWKNGNQYIGDFYEDKRQGKGTFNFANGNTYVGDFVNGVFEGNGRYSFGDGFYEGEWTGGRYHGQGFLLFSDNSSYRGGFVNGVAHGPGCETSADGTVKQGHWENGRPKAQAEG